MRRGANSTTKIRHSKRIRIVYIGNYGKISISQTRNRLPLSKLKGSGPESGRRTNNTMGQLLGYNSNTTDMPTLNTPNGMT